MPSVFNGCQTLPGLFEWVPGVPNLPEMYLLGALTYALVPSPLPRRIYVIFGPFLAVVGTLTSSFVACRRSLGLRVEYGVAGIIKSAWT